MKKHKLKWALEAKADLKGIKGYISQFAPRVAQAYVRRIRERCRKLTTLPRAAPIVEEFQDESIRETYFGNYRIIYTVRGQDVIVLRIFHSARLLTDDSLDESAE